MKVPLSWLAEFVHISATPEALASKLTAGGVKVEKIHRPGNGVKGIVVGEVLGIRPHPRADKLILVDVDTGSGPVEVVCGARNFSVKDRVPVAVPGSVLPGGAVIEARQFMGVTSAGMLCSAKELGLGDDHSGILVLGPDAELGRDLREVLGLPDAVFELEINPNRPDLMGMVGVAREVAALTKAEMRILEVDLQEGPKSIGDFLEVEVEDYRGCPRYLARVITGVGHAQSPAQVQYRLSQAGIRPISALVDATNYALLVTAQPLHAFDLDRLQGSKIVVRRARPGEGMTTIDGEQRSLDAEDLLIADEHRPVALAGVMGGLDSEVTPSTTQVALESAYFDPVSIFRTEGRHGLRTEASARFERGVDPNNIELASRLAASLMLEWGGGEAAGGTVDLYPEPILPVAVSMRPDRARALLGVEWSTDEMSDALRRLQLEPKLQDELIVATPPTYRVDLKAEEDLVEEVGRVIGYDRIPFTLPSGARSAGSLPFRERAVRRLKRVLVGAGLYEAVTSSFFGPTDLERFGVDPHTAIAIANPLNKDESLLRTTLLPTMLKSLAINFSRRPGDVRLFEVGKVFLRSDGPPSEPSRLGIVMGGPIPQEWHSSGREIDFFDLKGVVELALESFKVPSIAFFDHGMAPHHPSRSTEVRSGEVRLGIFGQIGPELAADLDLQRSVYMGELDLDALLELASPAQPAGERERFPAVYLDLAMAVPEGVKAAEILESARAAGGENLEDVRLIDVYRGEQVGEGSKSLALTLVFRSPDRTLTEAEALVGRDSIASAIAGRHGGRVRA